LLWRRRSDHSGGTADELGWLIRHGHLPHRREDFDLLTMKVFLRNKQTRLYRAASNEWAAAIAQALIFTSVRQAARFAFDQKVPEAEIVVRCDVLQQEVPLPLLPEWCDLDEQDSAAA
jgi:hypothetical protein